MLQIYLFDEIFIKLIKHFLFKSSKKNHNINMNSPSSTARFNFGANDAQFLGNRDTGQFSFGQPNSTIRGSQNVQLTTPSIASHASFGYPANTVRQSENITNVRNTVMGVQQSNIPQITVAPPPVLSPDQRNSVQQFSLPAPPQSIIRTPYTNPVPIQNQNAIQNPIQSQTQTQNPKMNVMHRPQVQSVNMDTYNRNYVNSLQTISQQRSSNANIRSTQGYNISQIQKQQYEKQKSLQQQAKCCFCFSKKRN